MKKFNDVGFVFRLFDMCFHDDMKFKKLDQLLKNMNEETKKIVSESENVSPEFLNKLIDQAKKERLNIYLQNIACMM